MFKFLLFFLIFSLNSYSEINLNDEVFVDDKININLLYPCIYENDYALELEKKIIDVSYTLNGGDLQNTSEDIRYLSYYQDKNYLINKIYNRIFYNLAKIDLYNINYDENSCSNINNFLGKNKTSDLSKYMLSEKIVNGGFIMNSIIEIISENEIKIQIFLWNNLKQRFLGGKYYVINTNEENKDYYLRISDIISDFIFKTTTGENSGIFDSKIIYISETGNYKNRKKQVNIMNFDGSKNIRVTSGNNLKLTPIFSKYNNDEIFYLEYMKDGAFIVKNNLVTGELFRIKNKTQNMTIAPSFNPSGKNQLIVSGSEEGSGTNLFLFDLDKKTNTKITNDDKINTSASFSPDGNSIVYVSDKKGGRKIFLRNIETGEEKIISFGKGVYDKPVWSPNGKLIAFIKIFGGKFHLGTMTVDGNDEKYLNSAYLIEGLRWSPNSRYLIYTKQNSALGEDSIPKIYIIDVVTKKEYKLNTPEFEGASDPDWIIN